jgi:hypothetical protein
MNKALEKKSRIDADFDSLSDSSCDNYEGATYSEAPSMCRLSPLTTTMEGGR